MPSSQTIRPAGRGRRHLAFVLVAGLLVGPIGTWVPRAGAQSRGELPDPEKRAILDDTLERAPRSPAAPDDDFERLRLAVVDRDAAALARMEATAAAEAANVQAFNAGLALETASKTHAAATIRSEHATKELAVEKSRLSELTVRAYVTGGKGGIEDYQAYVSGDTTDKEGGRVIMFVHVLDRQKRVTDQAERSLRQAKKNLADAESVLDLTQAFSDDRNRNAMEVGAERIAAEDAHETSMAEVGRAQDRLRRRRGFSLVPEAVPLIGIPRLNAEDLAGWFRQSPYRPRISTPVEDFARWFIEEGQSEGIRGDIAFAQAILETGGFANDDSVHANNYSGIGHCDTCASGWRFPSPQMGVRAQIQLLKSYALASPRYVHPKVDSRLRGPAGCCPTWGHLTTVWATDPTYGPKVMLIYSDIVAYALSRRAAGQGFDDPRAPLPLP